MLTIAELTSRHAQTGRVDWIGLRPARRAEIEVVASAALGEGGLDGDRARAGKRAITLFQTEHVPVIAALIGVTELDPSVFRRNVLISGLNLNALRGRHVQLGAATLEITGVCAPCSRMEAALGHGGYNAMRGHGGWCARVISPAVLNVGDEVRAL